MRNLLGTFIWVGAFMFTPGCISPPTDSPVTNPTDIGTDSFDEPDSQLPDDRPKNNGRDGDVGLPPVQDNIDCENSQGRFARCITQTLDGFSFSNHGQFEVDTETLLIVGGSGESGRKWAFLKIEPNGSLRIDRQSTAATEFPTALIRPKIVELEDSNFLIVGGHESSQSYRFDRATGVVTIIQNSAPFTEQSDIIKTSGTFRVVTGGTPGGFSINPATGESFGLCTGSSPTLESVTILGNRGDDVFVVGDTQSIHVFSFSDVGCTQRVGRTLSNPHNYGRSFPLELEQHILVGGLITPNVESSDVVVTTPIFDQNANLISLPELQHARFGAAMNQFAGGKIVTCGGIERKSGRVDELTSCELFEPLTATWTSYENILGETRINATLWGSDRFLYVIGGEDFGSGTPTGSIDILAPPAL